MTSDPVLVVEDDPKFGALVTRAFARSGMRSVHLLSGDGALRAMRSGIPFCAAVLDVMIPHPDGIEVCRYLRRLGSDIPVVAISARSSSDDRARVRAAGADAFLAKPFALTDLVDLTAALLRGEHDADGPSPEPTP